MDIATAHRLLSARLSGVRRWPVALRIARDGAEQMAALAHLSGHLPDCDRLGEVIDAALQGEALRDIGVAWRARYEQALKDVAAALEDIEESC